MELTCKPITRLKINKFPNHFIAFDTESKIINRDQENEKHELRLGVAIYIQLNKKQEVQKREVYYFKTASEFWRYVDLKSTADKTLYLYAHNAKYDTLNVDLLTELPKLGYEIPFPTINNAFIVSAKKGRKHIKIVDTFNYIRLPIEEIGKKLGIEKINLGKKGKIDFNAIPEHKLYEYCERDTDITARFMHQLIKFLYDNDLGSLKFTTASTALAIYRHKFINEPIYYHRNDKILKLERDGYRGGIVECGLIGHLPKDEYYLLDINSMYVSVMAKEPLPNYPILHIDKPNIKDFYRSLENGNYIIADVLIEVTDNNGKYGLKHDNKLIFPNGLFRVTLHSPELLFLLKNKSICEVYSYTVYNTHPVLSDYALYFSELKKNSKNKVDYELAKLFGNSGYGKFGMRAYLNDKINLSIFFSEEQNEKVSTKSNKKQTQETTEKTIPNISNNTLQKINNSPPYIPTDKGIYYRWGGLYYCSYTEDLKHVPRTNVALAGAITAYARILLSQYKTIAGYENCFYSDTDSLMVNKNGMKRLQKFIDDKELGLLKIEMIFNTGVINAPKNYKFISRHKTKVINVSTIRKIKHFTYKQKSINIKIRSRSKGIPTGAINDNGTYYFWRFTTFKDYLRSDGLLKGRILRNRKNSNKYEKGVKTNLNKKTQRTYPYIMNYEIGVNNSWVNKIINL